MESVHKLQLISLHTSLSLHFYGLDLRPWRSLKIFPFHNFSSPLKPVLIDIRKKRNFVTLKFPLLPFKSRTEKERKWVSERVARKSRINICHEPWLRVSENRIKMNSSNNNKKYYFEKVHFACPRAMRLQRTLYENFLMLVF